MSGIPQVFPDAIGNALIDEKPKLVRQTMPLFSSARDEARP
jgi:hypothetical protein